MSPLAAGIGLNVTKAQTIIQYFKILKNLTFVNGVYIKGNQLKILNFLLQNKLMIDIIKPINE